MTKVVPIARFVAARDRTLVVEILQFAQLAQALARYGRKSFLESPRDQDVVAERFARMSELASKVSEKTKRHSPEVPWEALAAAPRGKQDPAELWTAVRKVVPRLVAGLAPLAAASEAAPFALAVPETRASRKPRRR